MSLILTPGKAAPWDPVGTTPEATAFFHRIRDRGARLNATHVTAYNTLISSMQDVWGLFDALYMFATENRTAALINLISDNFHCTISPTATNDLVFTPGAGFQNTDVITPPGVVNNANYLDTNFNPTGGTGKKYTLTNGHLSAWSFTNIQSPNATSGVLIGHTEGTNVSQIRPLLASQVTNLCVNDQTGSLSSIIPPATAAEQARGWFLACRSVGSFVAYLNAHSQLSTTGALAGALADLTFTVLARRGAAAVSVATANQVAMASIGAFLTAFQVIDILARLNAFFTAVRDGVPAPT